MAAMATDMRNRFLVALVFAVLIAVWSPLGDFLGSRQGKALQREVVRGVFGLLRKRL